MNRSLGRPQSRKAPMPTTESGHGDVLGIAVEEHVQGVSLPPAPGDFAPGQKNLAEIPPGIEEEPRGGFVQNRQSGPFANACHAASLGHPCGISMQIYFPIFGGLAGWKGLISKSAAGFGFSAGLPGCSGSLAGGLTECSPVPAGGGGVDSPVGSRRTAA